MFVCGLCLFWGFVRVLFVFLFICFVVWVCFFFCLVVFFNNEFPSSDPMHQPWQFAIFPSFAHSMTVPTSAFRALPVFVAASATCHSVENGCGGHSNGFLAASLAFSWLKECPECSTVWTGISLPAMQPASATLSLQFVTHIWYMFSIWLRARLPSDSSIHYFSATEGALVCPVGLC